MTEEDGRVRLKGLRVWGAVSGKTFPWRTSDDPWLVFVAEVLLRRTRAEQVAVLLPQALKEFQDPSQLAEAPSSRVVEVFQSAGLHGRVLQLHAAASEIVEEFGGEVPVGEEELLSLTGVGPYVAAIVSSRLSGSRVVLVDTNSVRVAMRVLGVEPTTKDPRRERTVIEAVRELLGGPAQARDWFHVIDLAHAVCRPKDPACTECPLADACNYRSATVS